MVAAAKTETPKGSGGSALKRLKASLRTAGIVGQQGKASRSKKEKKRGRPSEVGKNDAKDKLQLIRDEFNPFELKTNHTKFEVIGRKMKGAAGKPTLSKQIGEENRKKTLLTELKNKNRIGGIIDKRFGESNPHLTPEEKMLERFTKERQRNARSATSLFNLNDDDEIELTHYGQSLSTMDDFDDAGLALSDDENDKGQLDRSIVSQMHFGGFDEDKREGEGEHRKSKNEIMKELIAKSKMHKAERQLAKQEDEALREGLDDDLEEIRGLLDTSKPAGRKPLPSQSSLFAKYEASAEKEEDEDNYGDYDKAIRELASDRRAMATDRTKTEEEIALEEKEKLEKAERARKRRMEGLDSESEDEDRHKRGHKRKKAAGPQADDLDDDFVEEMEDEASRLGKGLTLEDIQRGFVDDDDEEGDMDDDEQSDDEDEEESDEEADEDEEEEFEETDNEDLESEDEEIAQFDEDEDDMNEFGATGQLKKKTTAKKTKQSDEKREIPYTFECPTSHSELLEILDGLTVEDVVVVVKRIRVLYHIKLAAENRAKLSTFLGVLLDHISYVASTVDPLPNKVLEDLTAHAYGIAQQVPESAADVFNAKLKQMHNTMAQKINQPGSAWPDVEDLTTLRVIGQVFSTSDLNHPVATPAMLFMGHALAQCRIQSEIDIGRGLFLVMLFSEYQVVSKRYIPEVMNFLGRALILLSPVELFKKHLPGLFPMPEESVKLHIKDAVADDIEHISSIGLAQLATETLENDQAMRLSLFQGVLRMLERYLQLYASTPALVEVFEPFSAIISQIRSTTWHKDIEALLTALYDRLQRQIKFCKDKRTKTPLRMQQHRPIPIAQHLPKFEKAYSMDRHYDPDHERAQVSKLKSQLKKEKKGAMRELRKDNMFIAREKAKERKQKDEEYNKMIKGVMTILEGDQAEKNRLEREKKKL
ncbi:nucleolar protein 14 [Radiomyces spectabilis]|uniref:nucleolar protein 14 n=1 Tax=Radiomyces spectabilis TaxID=64574 RepID=UPI00221FB7B6|nr:nucleolar protein 14 [Radiomyces spectabilis]KAI8388156.1 nucleolar protein 14 [Radiomyces spectabilis]